MIHERVDWLRSGRRFMEVLTMFKRRGTHRWLGFHNLEQYTVERLGMSRTCVEAHVRLYEKLESLPRIAHAFYSGSIHQRQAELLASVATSDNEQQLLESWGEVATRALEEEIRNQTDQDIITRVTASLNVGSDPVADVRTGMVVPDDSVPQAGEHATSGQGWQTCAPGGTRTLRFWLPREVEALWLQVLVVCEVLYGGGVASHAFCLEMVVDAYLEEYLPLYRQESKAHPILERDDFRCAVPTCSSRKNLHDHHYIFRSHGGGNEPQNRGAVCQAHHLRGIHMGRLEVSGTAPHDLTWCLGVRPDGPPHLVVSGVKVIGGHTAV